MLQSGIPTVKALFNKHPWLYGGLSVASVVLFCSLAVHPSGSVKRREWESNSRNDLHFPPQVRLVLNRSCMDGHSNRTVWPWYSYVAPVSWMVERDVSVGRSHMNFSEWDRYPFTRRQKLLADVASVVRNREMPVLQYTLVHRDSRLSDEDTKVVYARAERRRLKATRPIVATGEGHRPGAR